MDHLNVLLVEDDEAEAFYIQRMLKQAEDVVFDVIRCVSLKNAYTVIENRNVDVCLLDLSLPDTHGYETVTDFAKNSNIPFIVLTGNDDIQMAMRTTRLGASDYLIKREVQPKPLERAILMAVSKSQRERAKLSRTYETLAQVMPSEQASVAVLTPRLSHLIEAVEDLEGYLRDNAPNLLDDVDALLAKHRVHETIKESRDILRMHAGRRPRRKISDAAMETLETVSVKRPSKPPEDWETAEALFDEVAARGEARE